jgi:hypothetical protein
MQGCAERLRLMVHVNRSVQGYAMKVNAMTDLMAQGLETEVAALRRACRSAWAACEEARIALSRHEADHGCSVIAEGARRSPPAK